MKCGNLRVEIRNNGINRDFHHEVFHAENGDLAEEKLHALRATAREFIPMRGFWRLRKVG
jgi:hypothetical protein